MLDLDRYMNHSIEMKVFGKKLEILEPSFEMLMKVDELEKDLTSENLHERRLKTAELFLNHNKQGVKISQNDIKKLPFEAVSRLIAEVSAMRYEGDQNPNSGSQSQAEK